MKGLIKCSMKFLRQSQNKAIKSTPPPHKFLTLLFAFFLAFSVSSGGSAFAADWTVQTPMPGSVNGIWGSASSDIFAVRSVGDIVHYDGSSWSSMTSETTNAINSVWGSASNDVFAVGANGLILHYDGSLWSTMTSGTTNKLNGVWGSASNDIFAVGDGGTILHYDGSSWSTMTSGTTNKLNGVWGSASNDVFAVGAGGTVVHYDGSSWSTMTSGTTNNLNAVWGIASNNIFAVGDNIIVNYDGSSWSTISSGTKLGDLNDVWGSASNDVFVVGTFNQSSVILHYDGSSWPAESYTSADDLYGVWGSASNDVFAVGEAAYSFGGRNIFHLGGSETTPTITPDIKANGSDVPITLGTSDILSVSVSLTAGGSSGMDCDWWVAVNTPFPPPNDWYYYNLGLGWTPGLSFTYQGPLFDLSTFTVLNMPGLPAGTYTFYFAIDTNMNGVLDFDELFFDSVVVYILP